jgi:homocitrate synthase NifV
MHEMGKVCLFRKVKKIARHASHTVNLFIPLNQPGVGTNVFARESGILAEGSLDDGRNCELYDAEAGRIPEFVQHANLHIQKPLTDYELKVTTSHTEAVKKILTVDI